MSALVKLLVWNLLVLSLFENGFSYNTEDNKKEFLRVQRETFTEKVNKKICVTPDQPKGGKWFYLNNSQPVVPLQEVPLNTTIGFKCKEGYLLTSNTENEIFAKCVANTRWNETVFPVCKKLCPPFYNTSIIKVYCKNIETNLTVPCNSATNNTLLTYECAKFYEPSSPKHHDLLCLDGMWDYERLPLCVPECGGKAKKLNPLIVGGKESKIGKYPWVVALYSSRDSDPYFSNICGGTILTPDIVLTAAHCVTRLNDGFVYKAKYFRVSAGKLYNPFEDERDSNTTQTSEVEYVLVHPEYKGEIQQYRFDIALLKLKTPFILTDVVQPVCFSNIKTYSLGKDPMGWVSGWGYTTTTGDESDILKELNMPIRERNLCFKDFDEEWADQFFTDEKLCAGYVNQSTSVCKGDSGGGLILQHPKDKLFYVFGVVSLGHSYIENNRKHCNIQKSALFTKVESYFEWLQNSIAKLSCARCQNSTFGLSTDGCDFCFCLQKFCPLSKSPLLECGRTQYDYSVLLEDGQKAKSVLPWALVVANRNHGYICSATLLTTNIAILGASCITEDNGKVKNITDFLLESAAELYSLYIPEERKGRLNDYRLRDFESVVIHPDYRGKIGNDRDNLAIVKIKEPFQFHKYVQPVCYEDLLTFSPKEGAVGSKTIWGYIPFHPLWSTRVPVRVDIMKLNYSDCFSSIFEEDWVQRYLTTEKICAGYLNQSLNNCRMDVIGSGLVFTHPENGRYYLYGVETVSTVPKSENVSNFAVNCLRTTVYTDIRRYLVWIKQQVASLSSL